MDSWNNHGGARMALGLLDDFGRFWWTWTQLANTGMTLEATHGHRFDLTSPGALESWTGVRAATLATSTNKDPVSET